MQECLTGSGLSYLSRMQGRGSVLSCLSPPFRNLCDVHLRARELVLCYVDSCRCYSIVEGMLLEIAALMLELPVRLNSGK